MVKNNNKTGAKSRARSGRREPPLVVDLDGTLVQSDLLYESIFALLKKNPLLIFQMLLWLLDGKAAFKQRVAERVDLDVVTLPYHAEFLAYLQGEHKRGRRLVLATASNEKYAQEVAICLGLFDGVLASNAEINVSGSRKLELIRERVTDGEFDYAGNAHVDVGIWKEARCAIVVSPGTGVARAAAAVAEVSHTFAAPKAGIGTYLYAIRVHQWLKNCLIFVPLLAAHKMGDMRLMTDAVLAFLAYSLCASSAYVLNDILDLAVDRLHPRKCKRPFAAGTIPIARGVLMMVALLGGAILISLSLPLVFIQLLFFYYIMTLAYSLDLKKRALIDVLVLAGLYTLRIVAGAAAVTVVLSFWMLAFSMFIFLSLAMVKRYTELQAVKESGEQETPGRGYLAEDMGTLTSLGGASGYLAVLVLALYINSEKIAVMYKHPQVIWLICPLLLYWISRVWMLARRGDLHDDPVVFALEDSHSRMIAVLFLGIMVLAAW